MRIAYLMEDFPVLSQTFLLNQVRGLIDHGHQIEIFAEWREPSEEWISEPLRSRLREATRHQPSIPTSRLERFASALRIVASVPAAKRRSLFRTLNVTKFGAQAASLRLLHLAARFEPGTTYDAIRACFGPNGVRAMMLREVGAFRGPLATSFHGYDLSALAGNVRRDYPRLFASGEVMLPTGDALARTLVERGCPENRVTVLPSAIDCDLFRPSERRPPDRPLHVLSIGRLVEKKGFATGIQAVARAAADGLDVRYTIVGDGPLRDRLEKTAVECGADDRVRFAGALPPSPVRDLIQSAHLVMAPSVETAAGDRESRLNVVKEAFACAVPVVATLHGGIRELVDDGRTGLLVDEFDVEALAGAVAYLASNPGLSAEMGRRGRDTVVATYDIETLTIKLEAILAALSETE